MDRPHQTPVGGDQIAHFEHNDVAGDKIGSRNPPFRSISDGARVGSGHLLEGRQRCFCPALLRVADRGVHENYRQDHAGVHPVIQDDATDEGSHEQHPDQGIGKLTKEELQP